jgi:hypothetical protein
MDIQLITGQDNLNKAIQKVHTLGVEMDKHIHITACSVLAHFIEHGDCTLCTNLVDAMPQSGRKKGLIEWFRTFGNLKYDVARKVFGKGTKAEQNDLQGAITTPFWDLTPEKDPAPITIEGILSMVQSRIKKGKEQGDITNADVHKLGNAIGALMGGE